MLLLRTSLHFRYEHECDILVLKVHGLTPSEISEEYLGPFLLLHLPADSEHRSDAIKCFGLQVKCPNWHKWDRRERIEGEDELCLLLPNVDEPGLDFEIKKASEEHRIGELRDDGIGDAGLIMSVYCTENLSFHVLEIVIMGMNANSFEISYESGYVNLICIQEERLVQELFMQVKCPTGVRLESNLIEFREHSCAIPLVKTDHRTEEATMEEAEVLCRFILDRLLKLVDEEKMYDPSDTENQLKFNTIKERMMFWIETYDSCKHPCIYAASVTHVELIRSLWGRAVCVKSASIVSNRKRKSINKSIIKIGFLKVHSTTDDDDDTNDDEDDAAAAAGGGNAAAAAAAAGGGNAAAAATA